MRNLRALFEAFKLLGLADGQPEFRDDGTTLDELFFEFVNLVIGALPVRIKAEVFDPLHQHPAVPRAIKNDRVAERRYLPPEPPQIRLRAFFVAGGCNWHDVIKARIHRPRDASNGAALAGGVHAFEHHDDGAVLHLLVAGEEVQLALQLVELFLVTVGSEFARIVGGVEHIEFIGAWLRRWRGRNRQLDGPFQPPLQRLQKQASGGY